MNILFVASLFYPDSMGGSDRYIYEIASRLVQLGNKVTVLTANQENKLPKSETIAGIKVHRYDVNNSSSTKYYLTSIFNAQKEIMKLVRDNEYDIMALSHILPSFGAFLADNKIPKVYLFYAPYVLEFKDKINYEITQSPGISTVFKVPYMNVIAFFLKRIEKYIIWKSKAILALSEYSKNQIEKLYRQGEKVTVINAGIDTDYFKPLSGKSDLKEKLNIPQNVPILLTIRRLYHRMGIEELILAIKNVKLEIPDLVLLIGGKGPLKNKLQKLSNDNNLQDNIRFLDFIDEKEIVEYYNVADYFILPSRSLEGFGLVTLEALACGIPVLGTPVGATPNLLGELDPILLFDEKDAEAISEKIINMVKNYSEYSQLTLKCREYTVNNFSWEQIMGKITELFQKNVL